MIGNGDCSPRRNLNSVDAGIRMVTKACQTVDPSLLAPWSAHMGTALETSQEPSACTTTAQVKKCQPFQSGEGGYLNAWVTFYLVFANDEDPTVRWCQSVVHLEINIICATYFFNIA
jgi:hypothetical protein